MRSGSFSFSVIDSITVTGAIDLDAGDTLVLDSVARRSGAVA